MNNITMSPAVLDKTTYFTTLDFVVLQSTLLTLWLKCGHKSMKHLGSDVLKSNDNPSFQRHKMGPCLLPLILISFFSERSCKSARNCDSIVLVAYRLVTVFLVYMV